MSDDGQDIASNIATTIAEYSTQGIHRTGTEVDQSSADWLATKIRQMGITPQLDAFDLSRVEVHDARLILGELQLIGVPLFDGGFSGPAGITGSLGPLGSEADIGVAMVPPYENSEKVRAVLAQRQTEHHRAILLVTDQQLPPGVATLNAESFLHPFGPPVLQLGGEHWPLLLDAIEGGRQGTVVVDCSYVPSQAFNVQATVVGSQPALAPIVVMTPRSGWWACASERGGGIAAWLEMLRAVYAAGSLRTFVFTANSGHELGHLGMRHFLAGSADLVSESGMWVHLGANFAAGNDNQVILQYSGADTKQLFSPHLRKAGIAADMELPEGRRPFFEARDIHDLGKQYISIVGRNKLFHHPNDIWPAAVDLPVTVKWVTAFRDLALSLSR